MAEAGKLGSAGETQFRPGTARPPASPATRNTSVLGTLRQAIGQDGNR
jgi:hypothetical protein